MATATGKKIQETQNSFPAQAPGAVAECPFKAKIAEEKSMPIAANTAYQLTQDMAQTMGVIPTTGEKPEEQKEKKAWIEIILVDKAGEPMPGIKYKITSPSGEIKEGRLNKHGQASYHKIEPGDCKITFPDLDKDAWE